MQKSDLYKLIESLPSVPTARCKRTLSHSLRAVLKAIVSPLDPSLEVFAANQNKIFVSRKYLAAELGCTTREISRKITHLENLGYIVVEECYNRRDIKHDSNIYRISPIVPLAAQLRPAAPESQTAKDLELSISEMRKAQVLARPARINGSLGGMGKERASALAQLRVTADAEKVLELHGKVLDITARIQARAARDVLVSNTTGGGCRVRQGGGDEFVTRNTKSNTKSNTETSLPARVEEELPQLPAQTPPEEREIEPEFESIFSRFSALPNVIAPAPSVKANFIRSFKTKAAQGLTSLEQLNANLDLWKNDYYIQQTQDGRDHIITRLFSDLPRVSWAKRGVILKSLSKEHNKLGAIVGHCQAKGLDVYKFTEWLYDGKGPTREELQDVLAQNMETNKEAEASTTQQGEDFSGNVADQDTSEKITTCPEIAEIEERMSPKPQAQNVAQPQKHVAQPQKLDPKVKELVAKIQLVCVKLDILQKNANWLIRYKTEIEPRIQTLEDASRVYNELKTCAEAA